MNKNKYIITKTPNSFLFDLKEIWKSKFIIYEFAKKELKLLRANYNWASLFYTFTLNSSNYFKFFYE